MATPCPQCNKFVSLETGEPELSDISEDHNENGSFTIRADGSTPRNCQDCSTTMKQCSWDMEATIELSAMEQFKALPEEKQKLLLDAFKGIFPEVDGEPVSLEIDLESDTTEADESGGGRYEKNIITSKVDFTLKIELGEIKVEHTGQLTSENAASEFEEC